MFPADRQAKLDPIIAALNELGGVQNVQQDDWDSAGIVVHIQLRVPPDERNLDRPVRFARPLRVTMNGIRKVLGTRSYTMDDAPKMKYQYVGRVNHLPSERIKDRYDKSSVSATVYV